MAVLVASHAMAHERSRSNSVWTPTDAGVAGRIYLEARQATLLLALNEGSGSLEAAYRQRLVDGIHIERGGQACALDAPPAISLRPDGRLEGSGSWTCPRAGPVEISVQVFSPLSANHVHFIRWQTDDGVVEQVLSRGRTTFSPNEDHYAAPTAWMGYLALGFEHILGGPDHVAFVLGLMLLVSGWRRIALVTIGFTLGHSITLALAVLGWVSPPGAAIESLIGFSILFIAGEAALSRRPDFVLAGWSGGALLLALALISALTGGLLAWPVWLGLIILTITYFQWLGAGGRADVAAPALSAGFGLVHGVGFAGILLEVDISGPELIPSLLSFNVGVELGQLAIVISALAVLALIRQFFAHNALPLGRAAMIGVLACLGSFWFLGRAFT
ncbi:HupE/UreJ family protein [Hyphobacterium sp. HN65]|uniref:HupE/UreJ family protein n=1 Tax=Hyphobacterium lacteum TaxID=3116575 RepID=A0ABU7LTD5_9PROT|nr:HupE/UreJ family protein [Hyphobacterium sp. HN65]MEE2527193.1 HupE/UreJ family protein [Hyphobacterium sp. HN65]